jgi:amino acid permease
MGIVVNVGGNADGHYIGGENWHIPGAPFVDGIGGFASVFVTASFACKLKAEMTPSSSEIDVLKKG